MKAIPPTSLPLDCLFAGRAGSTAASSIRTLSTSPASPASDSPGGQGIDEGLDPLPVFRELSDRPTPAPAEVRDDLDRIAEVAVTVRIELGRARLKIADVLSLEDGSVIQLDRAADDLVDVYVNDRLVARGEVVVANEQFAVRLMEVVSPVVEE